MAQIKTAEHLLNSRINFPEPSSFLNEAPVNVRPKNHSQEMNTQATVNIICSVPLYFNALVPITPIVSKIACGFRSDTESAKRICFFIGNASLFTVFAGFERQML